MIRSDKEAEIILLSLWNKLDLETKNHFLDSVEDASGYDVDFFWMTLLFLILLSGYKKKDMEEKSEKLSNFLRPYPLEAYPSVEQSDFNTKWGEAEELIKQIGGKIDYYWT